MKGQISDLEVDDGVHEDPPPAYSEVVALEESFVSYDGRIDIRLDSKVSELISRFIPPPPFEIESSQEEAIEIDDGKLAWDIPLNIAIQVVGSRGDVQPFVALGVELQRYGHRIRIATHGCFEEFVRQAGLEFYSIGGDPQELMAYMVKNPGLIPGMKTLRKGDIQRKRVMISEMLEGCWASCIEPDQKSGVPFVAQAIIANPVSFAHIHCAELLSIPVHLMFTMPWTSTRAFPHPLANIKSSQHESRITNYLSYVIVDWMTWQGVGSVINTWRKSKGLTVVPQSEGPFLASTLKIPHTYCWSPTLIPKPNDWADHIDVCGFFFRETPAYSPPAELDDFLSSGPTPIYIGFGSIVVDDPASLTEIILGAVEASGVRAVISRGWSKIGEESSSRNIFYLDDCPHEWLFQRVSTVVHHGGAGTTACGLLNARPTVVVPFFGDQPFWGEMIANANAGPSPIPYKKLTVANLAKAIMFCLKSEVVMSAQQIADKMRLENGVSVAVASFHRHLPKQAMHCDLIPNKPATWLYTGGKTSLKLSNMAVENLRLAQGINFKIGQLKHYGPKVIIIKNIRWDPITSTGSTGFRMASDFTSSAVGMFADPVRVYFGQDRRILATENQGNVHGRAAMSVVHNIDDMALGTFKKLLVDVPLAMAEGFRNAPRVWGEDVPEAEEITDWKSGVTVAGKSFAYGLADGFGGFFYKPVLGARDEGLKGFGKGFGKGLSGLVTGPLSGTAGLVGYTGDGISRSLGRAMHWKTTRSIPSAKRAELEYLRQSGLVRVPSSQVVQLYLQRQLSKK